MRIRKPEVVAGTHGYSAGDWRTISQQRGLPRGGGEPVRGLFTADVNHRGGISEIKKIAALAEVYYIDLIPHNNAGPLGSAATLHAALAIPNITLIEAGWANGNRSPDVVKPFPTARLAVNTGGQSTGVSCCAAEGCRHMGAGKGCRHGLEIATRTTRISECNFRDGFAGAI